jgi:adenylate cyclase class IV
VASLGGFVELETVLGDGEPAEAGQAEYDECVRLLGLDRFERVAGSYGDLR